MIASWVRIASHLDRMICSGGAVKLLSVQVGVSCALCVSWLLMWHILGSAKLPTPGPLRSKLLIWSQLKANESEYHRN